METDSEPIKNKYANILFCSCLDTGRTITAVAKAWGLPSGATFFTDKNTKDIESLVKNGLFDALPVVIKEGKKRSGNVVLYTSKFEKYFDAVPDALNEEFGFYKKAEDRKYWLETWNNKDFREFFFDLDKIKAGLLNNSELASQAGLYVPIAITTSIITLDTLRQSMGEKKFDKITPLIVPATEIFNPCAYWEEVKKEKDKAEKIINDLGIRNSPQWKQFRGAWTQLGKSFK